METGGGESKQVLPRFKLRFPDSKSDVQTPLHHRTLDNEYNTQHILVWEFKGLTHILSGKHFEIAWAGNG